MLWNFSDADVMVPVKACQHQIESFVHSHNRPPSYSEQGTEAGEQEF